MNKLELTPEDHELVKAACDWIVKPVLQIYGEKAPALVGAALRLDNGRIITANNLTVDVGSISMCAEPFAIAEANREPERKITTIVAVYHEFSKYPKVIPPCGRCREVITDFASSGFVIMRDPGTPELYKVRAADLLPFKYGDYWQDGKLV